MSKRHTDDEKRELIRSFNERTGTGRAWAKKNGVPEQSIYGWMKSKALAAPTAPANTAARRVQGERLSPEQLEALNEDILADMSEEDLRAKYNITSVTLGKYRKQAVEVKVLTPDQCKGLLTLLGRVAERRPEVFSSLGIMQKLAKHSDVLIEVML